MWRVGGGGGTPPHARTAACQRPQQGTRSPVQPQTASQRPRWRGRPQSRLGRHVTAAAWRHRCQCPGLRHRLPARRTSVQFAPGPGHMHTETQKGLSRGPAAGRLRATTWAAGLRSGQPRGFEVLTFSTHRRKKNALGAHAVLWLRFRKTQRSPHKPRHATSDTAGMELTASVCAGRGERPLGGGSHSRRRPLLACTTHRQQDAGS